MATIPNSKYIPINFMQEYFVDKDSGCPMAAGTVTFYRDSSRLVLKPVFKINFDGTNYTYTALPNPIVLSSVGTFADASGNDVTAYYYPYDAGGDLDLYYAVVENSGAVSQFTREGQPTVDTAEGNESDIVNFVPNGQFLLHNNLTESTTTEEGEVVSDVTEIAPGNWTFERSSGSTASDFVLFERLSSAVQEPTDNPRYQVRILCNAPDITDEIKGLRLRFNDVNKFSDTAVGEVTYTYSFEGASNGATGLPISINLIKNYGTGGDAEETILQSSFNLATGTNRYNIPISFTTNDGKILGEDDDDFLQLEIAIPASSALDCVLDNFSLEEGTTTATSFPIQTNSQMLYRTLPGSMPIPDYDGMDLYLPTVLGPNGLLFDDTSIGYINRSTVETLEITELALNGTSYLVANKDARSGIPYRRLYNKWSAANASDNGLSIHGASTAYVWSQHTGGISVVEIVCFSTATSALDGTPATGFTFNDTSVNPYRVDITPTAASLITAGANFIFYSSTGLKFVPWYTIDGVGTEPVVSGAIEYIKIELDSADLNTDVTFKTVTAINSLYIWVPDLRGFFDRNWADGSGRDPNSGTRGTLSFGAPGGDHVGSDQGDENKEHTHPSYMRADSPADDNPSTNLSRDPYFGDVGHYLGHLSDGNGIYTPTEQALVELLGMENVADGGDEARPVNYYTQWVVKY